jgi:hypothetical protein
MDDIRSNVQLYEHPATAHEIARLRISVRVEGASEFPRLFEDHDVASGDGAVPNQVGGTGK